MKVVPRTAIGLVLAVVAITAVIGLTTNVLLYERTDRLDVREEEARRTSEHIVVVARMLEDEEDPQARAKIVKFTSTEHFKVELRDQPVEAGDEPTLQEMRRQMVKWEPTLAGKNLRMRLGSPEKSAEVVGSLQLNDGSWLHFRAQDLVDEWPLKGSRIAIASIPMLVLALVAVLALRAILRPLNLLADAVTRVGIGNPTVLQEQGLPDFRRLIRAYNDMQGRIVSMIESRTEALAAVGHDLRTPLARMRLNADSVEDCETRDALLEDLHEMEQMVEALLLYFRGDDASEKSRLVDLAVLSATVVYDLRDRGYNIRYDGPRHCDAWLRPVEFKRALSNLTHNACVYGTRSVVRLHADEHNICIRVEDNGPGIPERDMQRVLEPFQRLELARERNTRGVGLGIPIALRVVKAAGGTLRLSNMPEGGLRAQIDLPRKLPAILCNEAEGLCNEPARD